MASSLAAQLKSISSAGLQAHQGNKRPITRPSLLFDPRQAADVSLHTIHAAALEGLDRLVEMDKRFASFRNTLFSFESQQMDRELQNREYNAKIDKTIGLYLRLVSGHLLVGDSHKTLEYLIRRYKIWAYNADDLILCALPYHETSLFVRIVQLLDLKKTKWHFLEGVKESGAPPPRHVLVQQFTRELAILETICEYSIPVAKSQPYSTNSVSFCVALIMETLGVMKTVNTDIISRILPFIFRCLDNMAVLDYKVGGLMVVGTLASRATLSEKLVKQLLCSVAKTIHKNLNGLHDISLLQMALMVMIKLAEVQSVDVFPWKAIEALAIISDLAVNLAELSKTFYMEKFLLHILDGLVYHSFRQKSCQTALISIIDAVPMKGQILHVVSKVLEICMGSLLKTQKSEKKHLDIPEAMTWARCVLLKIEKIYPVELDKAVCNFLEKSRESLRESVGTSTVLGMIQTVFNGSLHTPMEESNASVYVSLEHPQPQIRAAAVSSLATMGIVGISGCDAKTTINLQEALLRRLHDDDLSVVHAALALKGLVAIIDPGPLLKALTNNLSRCFLTYSTGSKASKEQAYSVADLCLELASSSFLVQYPNWLKEVAAMILPYILILPKTWRLNQKALQIATRISWPFFNHLSSTLDLTGGAHSKKLGEKLLVSLNSKMIKALSDALLENVGMYLPWLIQCCKELGRVKPLMFLILIHSFMQQSKGKFWYLVKGSIQFIKQEWPDLDTGEMIFQTRPNDIDEFLVQPEIYQEIEAENKSVHVSLLVATLWSLLKNLPRKVTKVSDVRPHNSDDKDQNGDSFSIFEDLFVLFAMSPSTEIFKEHIHLLVTQSALSAVPFLSKFFMAEGSTVPVAVQVESLNSLSSVFFMLSSEDLSEKNGIHSMNPMYLQHALPCIFVALCSAIQAVRKAATKCMRALHGLWCQLITSSQIYGAEAKNGSFLPISVFGEFMESIVQVKKLFESDGKFLGSFLGSLNSSAKNISAPDNLCERFDENTKEVILLFVLRNALELPTYAKWTILSALQGAGHLSSQVAETRVLLSGLLLRRRGFHLRCDTSQERLSLDDIQLLCILLKTYMMHLTPSTNLAKQCSQDDLEPLFEALLVEGVSHDDAAGTRPCILALESLSSMFYDSQDITTQDQIFQRLILLFNSNDGSIHNALLDALQRINVNGSIVAKHLTMFLAQDDGIYRSKKRQKRSKTEEGHLGRLSNQVLHTEAPHLNFVGALLEFLVWKKDLQNRTAVIEPLFKLLDKLIKDMPLERLNQQEIRSAENDEKSHRVSYLQQMVTTVLESISNSLLMDASLKVDISKSFNVDLVVLCVNMAKDSTSRNHLLSLLTSIARLLPDQVLGYVMDIFTLMGESTILQDDSHSQEVSKEMISAVVPCWLRTSKDPKKLLEVFIKALPRMSQHWRLAITKHLLGVLGERTSLPVILMLLLQSMVLSINTFDKGQDMKRMLLNSTWQHKFVLQLSMQYSSRIWLSSLVKLLERGRVDACVQGEQQAKEEKIVAWVLQIECAHLVADYLKSSEFSLQLENDHDQEALQEELGALMEQVVLQLQILEQKAKKFIVPSGFKNDAKEAAFTLLNVITKVMAPAAYSKGITSLLRNSDANVCEKALKLLCQNLKDNSISEPQRKRKKMRNLSIAPLQSLGQSNQACEEMILQIVGFLNRSQEDSPVATKISAVATLDVLTKRFAGNFPTAFTTCLRSVVDNLKEDDIALSSGCLSCIASLVSELGPQSLVQLPHIILYILQKTPQVCLSSNKDVTVPNITDTKGNSEVTVTFLISVLRVLDAIVNKMGGFLNPYLGDIVGLLVLQFTRHSDLVVGTKAASIRTLMAEKISIRLLLEPMLRVYEKAADTSEASVSAIFEMLAVAANKMDRQSVANYHTKIFKSCLVALDLRHQRPQSIKDFAKVETSVINALVSLTLKLSEATFKPLFIRTLEWAESDVDTNGSSTGSNLQRKITFYTLVNSLIGKLRSVFVPYFQYLMDGCVHHLSGSQYQGLNGHTQHKKKKSKLIEMAEGSGSKQELMVTEWHLRMLIISSLFKCFLYDTVGFLDSSKFQVLLKPIISQLVVEPPKLVDEWEDIPSIQEVDDLLVSCIGQMALTAGTDLLWKPLNHEVLMQTRSKRVRARILGLRIVKYLLDSLKEEYLILLPETIPFLGELLEDSELHVVAKAQEILKSMEDLSGESLSQYL